MLARKKRGWLAPPPFQLVIAKIRPENLSSGPLCPNPFSRSVVEVHEEWRRSSIHRRNGSQSTSRTYGVERDVVAGVVIDRQKRTRRVDDDSTDRENARCNGRPRNGGADHATAADRKAKDLA